MALQAKFYIGQIIHHSRFNYRGVIVDVDPEFCGTESWYEQVARSRPPKDQPWYRILVDGAEHETYVAERHLEDDADHAPIAHPMVEEYFSGYENGQYLVFRH